MPTADKRDKNSILLGNALKRSTFIVYSVSNSNLSIILLFARDNLTFLTDKAENNFWKASGILHLLHLIDINEEE